jgi:hypothetical protein
MSKDCERIHGLFNSMPRTRFPFDETRIPLNGIYILFEKGELAHEGDRIVRVGTHTGLGQLRSRLLQHFLKENKDRSIFRKNIGRALLNRVNDPFLEKWELDLTSKNSRLKRASSINFERQKKIEKDVTKYIQDNFSFVVFEVMEKARRLELESKIISTISLCDGCSPSKRWLGQFSPVEKIRENGLWNVQGLYKKPLSENEIEELGRV